MRVDLTYVDLADLGHLHTYDLSESKGELEHKFSPLHEDEDAVAVILIEGQSAETLEFDHDGERNSAYQYTVRESTVEFPIAAVSVPVAGRSLRVRLRYFGDGPVTLHIAIFRRIREAAESTIRRVITRFKDKCWACMRLVKFLITVPISGGLDEEAAVDAIEAILPEALAEWLKDSVFGPKIGDILRQIRGVDPRRLVAREVCTRLGFCP